MLLYGHNYSLQTELHAIFGHKICGQNHSVHELRARGRRQPGDQPSGSSDTATLEVHKGESVIALILYSQSHVDSHSGAKPSRSGTIQSIELQ